MTRHATGTFEVSVKPVREGSAVGTLGRMSLDKQFAGDLSGVGNGEMLTAMTQTKGSAGYVAIEQFTGTLHGRAGGFVFQHSGSMTRGAQQTVDHRGSRFWHRPTDWHHRVPRDHDRGRQAFVRIQLHAAPMNRCAADKQRPVFE